MKLKDLENKKIVILGLGKEGMDNFRFLKKIFPEKTLGLADKLEFEKLPKKVKEEISKNRKIKLHLGKNYLKAISKYEVIFRTPGISLEQTKPFLTKEHIVTSQAEIFLENCKAPIIGVTGTKGKGTTTTLIYKILKKSGLKVDLIGNIGSPVLSYLFKKNDAFVYELSSHQLANLKKIPFVAIFLNLYPAHLDYYKSFVQYQKSKENITLFQGKNDWFIYNKDQQALNKLSQKTKAQKVSFGLGSKNLDCYVKNGWILYENEKILDIKDIPLVGEFWVYNIMASICVAKLFNIQNNIIRKTIKEFKPLPHRLEFVGKFRKIEFYNDSLATIPEATILGIQAFKNKLETLILGGYDAKQNFKDLVKTILKSKIKNLIFFPSTGKRIWKEIIIQARKEPKNLKPYFVDNMKNAVLLAFLKTKKQKVCLLSCACPSFGVFKDYKERGNLFKKFVKRYGKKA